MREALDRLTGRFSLVACVSGRRAEVAHRLVGLDEVLYVGLHGFETFAPGDEAAQPHPAISGREEKARHFVEGIGSALDRAGLRVEDKGPVQALHWRGVADEEAAEDVARRAAERARELGLFAHPGRKVLEIRPIEGIDKGSAMERLLADEVIRHAVYGGDDRTDLDAFRAMRWMVRDGHLSTAVCIGVASEEGPEEIRTAADAVVESPGDFLVVLRALTEDA